MANIKTPKPVLGIDLDEVVFYYNDSLREYMIENGITPPEGDPIDYSFMVSGWFDSDEDFRKMHGEAVDKGLYRDLKPKEDAVEMLWELSRAGYEINIITSRFVNPGQHERVVKDTAHSLEKHNIPHSNLSFLKNKTLQYADLYVDDAPRNVEALRAAGRKVVTFDLAYNRHLEGLRTTNWQELREMIRVELGK